MANKKISELVSRVPSLTDLMLVGDPSSGYSYKCTVNDIALAVETGVAGNYVTLATTQTISGAKTFSNVLTLTSVANSPTDTDKFLVLNASNVVNYRTGAEVLSDIGAQAALTNPVTGTGTTNYLAKFTATSAIGNSLLFDDGTNVGVNTNSPDVKLTIDGATGGNSSINLTNFYASKGQSDASYLRVQGSRSPTADARYIALDVFDGGSTSRNLILNQSGGNVGIGTLSPSEKLEINGGVKISTIANATTDTDRFLVSDNGVVKYRTGAELLSDIGGASASSISGTTNYIPKFTSSSAIGNSQIFDNGTSIGFGTTSPNVSSLGRALTISSTNSGLELTSATNVVQGTVQSNTNGLTLEGIGTAGMRFFTSASGATSERMRLTTAGNLGINITTPYAKLTTGVSGTFTQLSNDADYSTYGLWIADANPTNAIGGAIGFGSSTGRKLAAIGAYHEADADQVGLKFYVQPSATGSSAFLTEAMYINSAGNLGLGVTPAAWGSGYKAFELTQGGLSGNGLTGITLRSNNYFDGTNAIYKSSFAAGLYNIGNSVHSWHIAPVGTAGNAISFTQAMTLDASGRLLLGTTTSSDENVTVYGSTEASMVFQNSTSGTGNGNGLYLGTVSGENYLWTYENQPLVFATNNAERMRITAAGNVGIGTTSPATKIQISDATNPIITLERVDANVTDNELMGQINFKSTDTNDANSNAYINAIREVSVVSQVPMALTFGTGVSATVTERMRITSAGNVGIGTSSPSSAFTTTLSINSSNSQGIVFRQNDVDRGYIYAGSVGTYVGSNAGAVVFNSNDTERMRLTSGGSLVVGGTTADASAIVQITSTTKGFLPPVMTGAQAEAIATPADGLLVYANNGNGAVITSIGWWGYNGTTWVKLN
jgi:hypothetical protein